MRAHQKRQKRIKRLKRSHPPITDSDSDSDSDSHMSKCNKGMVRIELPNGDEQFFEGKRGEEHMVRAEL
eukprot:7380214-Prymnesium_polylepis.1